MNFFGETKKTVTIVVLAVVVLILASSSFYTIKSTERGINQLKS